MGGGGGGEGGWVEISGGALELVRVHVTAYQFS